MFDGKYRGSSGERAKCDFPYGRHSPRVPSCHFWASIFATVATIDTNKYAFVLCCVSFALLWYWFIYSFRFRASSQALVYRVDRLSLIWCDSPQQLAAHFYFDTNKCPPWSRRTLDSVLYFNIAVHKSALRVFCHPLQSFQHIVDVIQSGTSMTLFYRRCQNIPWISCRSPMIISLKLYRQIRLSSFRPVQSYLSKCLAAIDEESLMSKVMSNLDPLVWTLASNSEFCFLHDCYKPSWKQLIFDSPCSLWISRTDD